MPRPRTYLLATGGSVAAIVLAAAGPPVHLLGVVQAVAGAVGLVSCSTLALNGSRPSRLSTRRAVGTVLATTAANAATPAGVGGTVLTLRVHRRTGLTAEQATAAAALRAAAGAVVALGIAAGTAGTVGAGSLPTPPAAVLVAVVLATLAALGVGTALSVRARRLASCALRAVLAAGSVLRRPRSCGALLVGCAGITLSQLVMLDGGVRAVGGHVAWGGLLMALLGSAAARSALPSPGGVGPIEAALIGGLTGLGLHLAAATVAVVVYRTAGHWLPTVAGAVSLRQLRRSDLL